MVIRHNSQQYSKKKIWLSSVFINHRKWNYNLLLHCLWLLSLCFPFFIDFVGWICVYTLRTHMLCVYICMIHSNFSIGKFFINEKKKRSKPVIKLYHNPNETKKKNMNKKKRVQRRNEKQLVQSHQRNRNKKIHIFDDCVLCTSGRTNIRIKLKYTLLSTNQRKKKNCDSLSAKCYRETNTAPNQSKTTRPLP